MRALLLSLALASTATVLARDARDAAACGFTQLPVETHGTSAFVVLDDAAPGPQRWRRLSDDTMIADAPAARAPIELNMRGRSAARTITATRRVFILAPEYGAKPHLAVEIALHDGERFDRAILLRGSVHS